MIKKRNEFIWEAQSEIKLRIAKTENICNQFIGSYSGYTSNITQVFLLVILGLVILVSFWAALNIEALLNIIPTNNYNLDLLLAKAAFGLIILYTSLHMQKKIVRILKISKIDEEITKVLAIKGHLQTTLNNINDIANDLEKRIWDSDNENLGSENHIDAEIAECSSRAKTYSYPDDNSLGLLLTIMHWLSGVFFVGVFLLISTPYVVEIFGKLLNIEASVILACFVYIPILLIVFYGF